MWKFSKFDEIMTKNREFQGNSKFPKICDYTGEYLLNLDEKWKVRKVNFCSFRPVWSPFGESLISFPFQQIFRSRKFRQIFKNSEIDPKKTLFSEACIFSNICRICMKSWLWERSNSEVFEGFYSVFVGPFAPDQRAK